MTPDPDQLLLIGTIGRPHGVAGAVTVRPETDDPTRFGSLERLFVGPSAGGARLAEVASVRFQPYRGGGTTVLLHLAETASREDAEALRGLEVYALVDDLPPLEDGEAYIHDLIGLAVVELDPDGAPSAEPLGEVVDVYEAGPALLLAVRREGRPQVLVPDVPEIVREVDLDAGRILVALPDGLLDIDGAAS